jgi:hypothetical protein
VIGGKTQSDPFCLLASIASIPMDEAGTYLHLQIFSVTYACVGTRAEPPSDPYRLYNEKAARDDRNLIRDCNESMDTMMTFVKKTSFTEMTCYLTLL